MKKIASIFLCLVFFIFPGTSTFSSDKSILIAQVISGVNSDSSYREYKKMRRAGKQYSFTSPSEAYEEGKIEGEKYDFLFPYYVLGFVPFFSQLLVFVEPISCPTYLTKNLNKEEKKEFLKGYRRKGRKKRVNATMISSAITISICILTIISQ